MAWYDQSDFANWERFYRANVLSSLSGYKPAMLVGTRSGSGLDNLAIFQNIVHLGANPALIGLINRPATATPHTLRNVQESGFFTLNAVNENLIERAHQTSAKFEGSEFEALDIKTEWKPDFPVPFVAESPVKTGLRLVEVVPIRHNDTFMIIGEVQCFFLQENLLQADGHVDLPMARLACTAGLDGYAVPDSITRFAYAKPNDPIRRL